MVAVDQEHGRGAADQSQEQALVQVDGVDGLRGRGDGAEGVHAEIVADGQVEIRPVRGGGLQGPGIERGVELLRTFGMRVALDLEAERAAGGALGVEALFGAGGDHRRAGLARLQTVHVRGVGFQIVQRHFDRFAGRQADGTGARLVPARGRAELDPGFQRFVREQVERDGAVGRPAGEGGQMA